MMKERRELKDLRKPVIYDEAGRKAKKKLTINYTGLVQSITFNWKFLSGDTAFFENLPVTNIKTGREIF